MKDDFVKLTNIVYKVLDYIPESDPLKNRAKDKALEMMEYLVADDLEKINKQAVGDIDVLMGYIKIGRSQGWISDINGLIIANEYGKIRNQIATRAISASESTQNKPPIVLAGEGVQKRDAPSVFLHKKTLLKPAVNFSERQNKIIEFLNKNESAQVVDLQTVLPDVTKRTIRRDLDELLGLKRIHRFGEYNQVFYRLAK